MAFLQSDKFGFAFLIFTFALSYDLIRLHQRPLRYRQADLPGDYLTDAQFELDPWSRRRL
jgi:hypothetical protein